MINLYKNNKNIINIIITTIIVVLLIILILILIKNKLINNSEHFSDETPNFELTIESVKNPYCKTNTPNESHNIIWQKLDSDFMKKNWPNTFDFDYEIKEDIINKALSLPLNSSIIDCGAHIGDGSVAIAHALKYHNRDDIIVYAIDPSKHKCDFIEFIKNKNNLNNLIVLNYGLSNENITYKTSMQSGDNTGAWIWSIHNENNNTNSNTINEKNINKFIKLDDLVRDNVINKSIGIIHFDVEGMEKEALAGGKETIEKYKPYMSIENNGVNDSNKEYFLEFLPKGYKYLYNKRENNILSFHNQ